MGVRDAHASKLVQQQNQELLDDCDEIGVDEIGHYTGNGEIFGFNDADCKDETVSDKDSTKDDTQFDFIVNMCNNEVGSGGQDKEMKIC